MASDENDGFMPFRGKEPFVATVVAQPVVATLTRSAIFLVLKVNPGSRAEEAVRSLQLGGSGDATPQQ